MTHQEQATIDRCKRISNDVLVSLALDYGEVKVGESLAILGMAITTVFSQCPKDRRQGDLDALLNVIRMAVSRIDELN